MTPRGEHPQYPGLPWVGGEVVFAPEVVAAIDAHALASYPSEACGFVFGPAETAPRCDEAREETNEADRYHALDPETFPRSSREYFLINGLRASRAFDEGSAAGRPLKVLYHSHCEAGAYFSDEDAATFSQGQMLTWPCAFLVVSVRDAGEGPRVVERRVWVHVPDTDAFAEAPFRVA
ncbi:MAG: Mov34/MPN/PAD-1 family protein [Myxococcota bacterium]